MAAQLMKQRAVGAVAGPRRQTCPSAIPVTRAALRPAVAGEPFLSASCYVISLGFLCDLHFHCVCCRDSSAAVLLLGFCGVTHLENNQKT